MKNIILIVVPQYMQTNTLTTLSRDNVRMEWPKTKILIKLLAEESVNSQQTKQRHTSQLRSLSISDFLILASELRGLWSMDAITTKSFIIGSNTYL